MLLVQAIFKSHCAEFEQEQLQARTNLLRQEHTNKHTTFFVHTQGTPRDVVLVRYRRTNKHSAAATSHVFNPGGETL